MAALINTTIPQQNFEKLRDRVGEILATELARQYQLDATRTAVRKVWVERFIPLDAATELPAINVNLQKVGYENKTVRAANTVITLNIDIYTKADSAPGVAADSLAMSRMQQLAGMIWAILSSPAYKTLGFTPGFVGHTMVEEFFVGDKSTVKDALSNVIGRLRFTIKSIEEPVMTDTAVPLQQATTSISINNSDKGMYYDFNPVQ